MIAQQIESDAPHPRAEWPIHVKIIKLAIRRDKSLLREVFGLVRLIEPDRKACAHSGLMPAHQFGKGGPRTPLRLGNEV
jgi:hypothetical protein